MVSETAVLDMAEFRLRLSVKRTADRRLDPRWSAVTVDTPVLRNGAMTTYGRLTQAERICSQFNDGGVLEVMPLSTRRGA